MNFLLFVVTTVFEIIQRERVYAFKNSEVLLNVKAAQIYNLTAKADEIFLIINDYLFFSDIKVNGFGSNKIFIINFITSKTINLTVTVMFEKRHLMLMKI